MRISDWSSDVCSSDLRARAAECDRARHCGTRWRQRSRWGRRGGSQHAASSACRHRRQSKICPPGICERPSFARCTEGLVYLIEIVIDRMSVAEGKRVSVRVDLGGRRILKKQTKSCKNAIKK